MYVFFDHLSLIIIHYFNSPGINEVRLLGRVGKDPVETEDGVFFSLATNYVKSTSTAPDGTSNFKHSSLYYFLHYLSRNKRQKSLLAQYCSIQTTQQRIHHEERHKRVRGL